MTRKAVNMKIAVTASEPSLDAPVDPRFGRCPYFVIVETDEDGSFEAVENPNLALGGGAGIQSAQLMAERGVTHVLTGNCGPNAYQTLSAAGIGVIVGCSGTASEVIRQFKASQLSAADEPNVAGKFGLGGASAPVQGASSAPPQPPPAPGTGMGMGFGAGRGMGRGMGRGRGGGGRGMGRGMGMGAGLGPAFAPTPQTPPESLPRDQELAMLTQQADAMARQMRQIQERISQLAGEGQGGTMAVVDPEKCTRCGLCVEVCPVQAISLTEAAAVVDGRKCTGCGACVGECPTGAISMV
jgi:predicted Fe-Mo cluster-binding NifX family protein/ferredoxin